MNFSQNYFELFELPVSFQLDGAQLGERFRCLQQELHPDRHIGAGADAQRLAMQYSSLVNEAYATLKSPLRRALYLLELAGFDAAAVAGYKPDGLFMMQQMEWRESLEEIANEADPEAACDELIDSASVALSEGWQAFSQALDEADTARACGLVTQMQYVDKFLTEVEQTQARLFDV